VTRHLERLIEPFDEPAIVPPALLRAARCYCSPAAVITLAGAIVVHNGASSTPIVAAPIETQIIDALVITRADVDAQSAGATDGASPSGQSLANGRRNSDHTRKGIEMNSTIHVKPATAPQPTSRRDRCR